MGSFTRPGRPGRELLQGSCMTTGPAGAAGIPSNRRRPKKPCSNQPSRFGLEVAPSYHTDRCKTLDRPSSRGLTSYRLIVEKVSWRSKGFFCRHMCTPSSLRRSRLSCLCGISAQVASSLFHRIIFSEQPERGFKRKHTVPSATTQILAR